MFRSKHLKLVQKSSDRQLWCWTAVGVCSEEEEGVITAKPLSDIWENLWCTWEFSLFSVKSAYFQRCKLSVCVCVCLCRGWEFVFSRIQTCVILWCDVSQSKREVQGPTRAFTFSYICFWTCFSSVHVTFVFLFSLCKSINEFKVAVTPLWSLQRFSK